MIIIFGAVYRSVVNISAQIYELCHRQRKYRGLYSAVLGYISMGDEENV